jgi:hypothetical protein
MIPNLGSEGTTEMTMEEEETYKERVYNIHCIYKYICKENNHIFLIFSV